MVYVALLWHQHQPLYKRLDHPTARGSYSQPWVRLHASARLLRDGGARRRASGRTSHHQPDARAALAAPGLCGGRRHRHAQELTPDARRWRSLPHEREEVLSSFFDADWHHQIYPHPRYARALPAAAARAAVLRPGRARSADCGSIWPGSARSSVRGSAPRDRGGGGGAPLRRAGA